MAPIACVHDHAYLSAVAMIIARSALRDVYPALDPNASGESVRVVQHICSTTGKVSVGLFNTTGEADVCLWVRRETLDGSLFNKCITWDKDFLRFSAPSGRTIVVIVLRYCDDSMERLERETLADGASCLHIHLTLKCAVDLKIDLGDNNDKMAWTQDLKVKVHARYMHINPSKSYTPPLATP